ncbi:hypothetical protein Hanom_Chr02g00133991 [Helianthus anomalus]
MFKPRQKRSRHLIEDITQNDIDSLSIKWNTVKFTQILENDKGLYPPQEFPFMKKR